MEGINFGVVIKHDLYDYEPIVEAFEKALQYRCKIVDTERISYTHYVVHCNGTLDQFNKMKSIYGPERVQMSKL